MLAARCPVDSEADLTPAFDAGDRFWGLDGRFTYARRGARGSWVLTPRPDDPAGGLTEIARVARPGGTVQVEVPTITAIGRLFRGRWLFLQAPTHLVHLRPRALQALVERAGVDVIKVTRPWFPSELAGSLPLAAGVMGFAPRIFAPRIFAPRIFAPRIFAPRGLGDHRLRWALAALMVIDVPVTLLAALLGDAGVVRVIARRRTA